MINKLTILVFVLLAGRVNAAELGERLLLYAVQNGVDPDPTLFYVDGPTQSIYWNVNGVPAPTEQTLPSHEDAEAFMLGRRSQPVDFPNGIAIPTLTNGTYYTITPTDEGELVVVEAHASPYDLAAHQQRITDEYNRRQAIKAELDLTAQQISDIQAYFTADADALFPGMSAAQRKFLKVQRAAVRYLLKQEVKELAP